MATGARRSVAIAVLAVGETVRELGLGHRHLQKESCRTSNADLEAGKEKLLEAVVLQNGIANAGMKCLNPGLCWHLAHLLSRDCAPESRCCGGQPGEVW